MKRLLISLIVLCLLPILASAQTDDIRRPKSGMSLGMNPSLSGGGFAYILRDDFSIAVAAGSVNGTAAVPGPGARTVTDSASHMSITGGKLTTDGGAGTGDPGIWYGSITRAVGRLLIADITSAAYTATVQVGFDNNQGASIAIDSLQFANALLKSSQSTVAGPQIYNLVGTTNYKVGIVLKSAGSYDLIKASGIWYLLYINNTNNTETLYPGINNTTDAATYSFLRIPNYLWTPTPISADSFGGTWPTTDGGGLTGIEAGGSGKTWTPSSTWSISSGAAVNAPVVGSDALAGIGSFTSWTGDNPNGWTLSAVEDATNYVTENPPGQCEIISDNTKGIGIQKASIGTLGTFYRIGIDVTTVTSGSLKIHGGSGGQNILINSTSIIGGTIRWTVADATLFVLRNSACDVTIDNLTIKSLTLNQLITSINHTSTPDCYMSVKPTIAAGFQAGIAFNIDDPNNPANFNLVYYNQNDGKIYWDKCVNGTYTNVFATTTTYSAGKALVVRKIGTSVYVWYNDAYVNSGTAAVTTGNYHGMFQTGSGTTETKLDDWFCYGSGTNGEYGILNAFSN